MEESELGLKHLSINEVKLLYFIAADRLEEQPCTLVFFTINCHLSLDQTPLISQRTTTTQVLMLCSYAAPQSHCLKEGVHVLKFSCAFPLSVPATYFHAVSSSPSSTVVFTRSSTPLTANLVIRARSAIHYSRTNEGILSSVSTVEYKAPL